MSDGARVVATKIEISVASGAVWATGDSTPSGGLAHPARSSAASMAPALAPSGIFETGRNMKQERRAGINNPFGKETRPVAFEAH